MSKLMKRMKARWRKLTNVSVMEIEGVRIDTTAGKLPRLVRSALFKETYEDAERTLIARLLKPGMRVVEIGTGIGFISLIATRICGEGNVISYEANPTLEPIIRGNFALNGLKPSLNMKAVTVGGEPITFFRSDNIISSSLYDRQRQDHKITVESDALSAVLLQHDPDVIIMDVEGAEIDLLAIDDLRNVRHIIVELHPHIVGEDKIAALSAVLEARGFSAAAKIHKTVHFARAA
ncbi:FkbM family methyltransferase [Rhizobium sp. 32-5/1]|uniref:FkbM family methyltransferase n=1 Tax=Rhizobium sp. 32-5/1 TaxID=3019602 RepID=UPI00240E361C|nr:FkbM family methyltransferase [Rhizobium sp. 32-5/1]WEZ82969.1 FkbM family methyltransferase [Rhizobium sp. 32-5/1]